MPRPSRFLVISMAVAWTAVAVAGCTTPAGPGAAAGDVRGAKVVATDHGTPAQTVDIVHYHGATVVRDRALAPADLDLRAGDRIRIDHSVAPPRVLSVVRAN